MYNLEKITPIIFKDKKIYQAVEKINKSKTKIIFVIDKKKKLLGSISSGDIRRSIRNKIDLNENVQKIMYKRPRYLLKKKKITIEKEYLICLPIVNKKKQIVDFEYSQIIKKEKKKYNFFDGWW